MGCSSIAGLSPSNKFTGINLTTWMERGTVKVKCLARKHNMMSLVRVEPRPLDVELSTLTMRSQHLPRK